MSDTPRNVKIVWILYLIAAFTGFPALIGVILAYIWRGQAMGHPMADHFDQQIKMFWVALIGTVIGIVLMLIFIGWIVFGLVAIYFAIMSILGLLRALNDKPWR